jgi:DnaK suppressor protein
MSTTAMSSASWPRVASNKAPAASSVPPPVHLTAAQKRELESELRRELAALERRLASEDLGGSAERPEVAVHDAAVATRRMSDTDLRRDLVAAALDRLASGEYGACAHCGEPIPFGRLLVMPEATHCLSCSRRS